MTLQKIILFIKRPDVVLFFLFLFLHVVFFNINKVEWGDSYRILRAAEFIRNGSYPVDEKRPPLFSLLLSFRPQNLDQILFSRIVVLALSIFAYIIFIKFLYHFVAKATYRILGILFFILNPIYFYWSIRVMSDVLFSVLVLCGLYISLKMPKKFNSKWLILLGVVTGLSILTRFEGYLLFVSVFVYLSVGTISLQRIKSIFLYCFVTFIIIIPYIIYKNPFGSSYFSEPSGRTYDFSVIHIYIASLLCSLGILSGAFFIIYGRKLLWNLLLKNVQIFSFISLELLLILLWPAAIPRLFMPLVPLIIVFCVLGIQEFFENSKETVNFGTLVFLNFLLVAFYALSQYFLKLQFLIVIKSGFILVLILSIINIFYIFKRDYLKFCISLVSILMIWTISTVIIHKNIYRTIKDATEYLNANYSDVRVAHNDINSIADWYLNYDVGSNNNVGIYFNFEDDGNFDYKDLKENDIKYVLITNEHNYGLNFSLDKKKYLMEEQEFRYNVNSKEFYTKVVKVL